MIDWLRDKAVPARAVPEQRLWVETGGVCRTSVEEPNRNRVLIPEGGGDQIRWGGEQWAWHKDRWKEPSRRWGNSPDPPLATLCHSWFSLDFSEPFLGLHL